MHIDESFRPQLANFSPDSFELSPDVTYIVDTEMCLRGYNDAWPVFARNNGGAAVLELYPLGRSILDAMHPALRVFYEEAYRRVLKSRIRFDQRFECSSATVFRSLQQSVYPLSDACGLVVTNHVVEERPMDRDCQQPSQAYLTPDQLVVQCCHCRRVADQSVPNKWVWIPQWVEDSYPLTTHTFCPTCHDFYYGSVTPPALDPPSRLVS